jgi:chromosome segregation ATPase
VWYAVRFEKEYEVPVDAPIVNSIDTEPFNSEGQAVLRRLRRGATAEEIGTVKFGPAEGQIQTAVLDQQTAESLIQQGIATLDANAKPNKIYRRKLTDYERKFRSIHEQIADMASRIRQLDLDNKAMLAATEKAQQQQALVEELKAKASADLAKVNYELAELTKYKDSLQTRLTSVQNELSQLYLANKALGRELARLSAELTEKIDQRSRQATAMTR